MADQIELEIIKGQITICVEGLKTLALINGAAAVATLTYLGNLAAKTDAATRLPAFKPALLCFGGGVLAAAISFIIAYAAQIRLRSEMNDSRAHKIQPALVKFGVLIAIAAASAFGVGCWLAADALVGF